MQINHISVKACEFAKQHIQEFVIVFGKHRIHSFELSYHTRARHEWENLMTVYQLNTVSRPILNNRV